MNKIKHNLGNSRTIGHLIRNSRLGYYIYVTAWLAVSLPYMSATPSQDNQFIVEIMLMLVTGNESYRYKQSTKNKI